MVQRKSSRDVKLPATTLNSVSLQDSRLSTLDNQAKETTPCLMNPKGRNIFFSFRYQKNLE